MSGSAPFETALVTGGSTGIGAAIAKALVGRGARVAVCARRQEGLDAMRAELGASLLPIRADLSDAAEAVRVVREAEQAFGKLDLVVANAGVGGTRPAQRTKVEQIVPILQTNVVGACATLIAALPAMLERGSGHLVGVSSIAGRRGLPSAAAYSASKAALSTFLESMRVDLARTSIRVTDIQPGFVDTPLTRRNRHPMPFIMPADRAAELILRAIVKGKRVYTFPWPMRLAVGLLPLIPDFIYERFGSRVRVQKD